MRFDTVGVSLGLLLSACSGGTSPGTGGSLFDADPPLAGSVRDGLADDVDVQASTTALAASWSGFHDAGSGIAFYEVAAGSAPGKADASAWKNVGLAESSTLDGLTLVPDATYYVSVVAQDRQGNRSAAVSSNGVRVESASGKAKLGPLSEEAAQLSLSAPFIWFNQSLKGGAHTWIFNGGEFGKAAMAFTGDTRADVKLLEQIRHLLAPGNGLTCTGGFSDQKQLGSTAMFLLAKNTPRAWGQLSTLERDKISTTVFGALVSSAFTTTDHNPFLLAKTQQRAINGDANINRDWNPNYRNGMVGTVIVASLFFGVDEARRMLLAHDHAAFVRKLPGLGLDNLHRTYTEPWGQDPVPPTTQQIETALHQPYVYHGIPHHDLMGIFIDLTEFTYERKVHCGLNGGRGILGSRNNVLGGYMAKGCDQLPNVDKLGMLREFDAFDTYGNRSSAHYANDGWYVNTYIHYCLLAMGAWQDSPRARGIIERMSVGTTDLLFKIDPQKGGGYYALESGYGSTSPYVLKDDFGHRVNRSVAEVVLAAHR